MTKVQPAPAEWSSKGAIRTDSKGASSNMGVSKGATSFFSKGPWDISNEETSVSSNEGASKGATCSNSREATSGSKVGFLKGANSSIS
jgi:hypothetical protein